MKPQQYAWEGDHSAGNFFTPFLYVIAYAPKPSTAPPYAEVGLTYKMLEYTLIGINQFRLAYPALNFEFQIYTDDYCVGTGGLWQGVHIGRAVTPVGDSLQVT